MKTKRLVQVLVLLCSLVVLILATACGETAITQDKYNVDEQQRIYSVSQPLPKFNWSLERAVTIQLYHARNEARDTWSYSVSMTGQAIFGCPSKGFPLPYDVQLTNPLQYIGSSGAVVEQAEPNGVYSSKNTQATWILCNRKKGVAPVYSEPAVMAFSFPVKIVNGMFVDIEDQPASVEININKPQ